MRVVGVIGFLVGAAGAAAAVAGALGSKRPRDVGLALAAPVAVVIAVVSLVLVFDPGFLG
jgi:hypothetical protein